MGSLVDRVLARQFWRGSVAPEAARADPRPAPSVLPASAPPAAARSAPGGEGSLGTGAVRAALRDDLCGPGLSLPGGAAEAQRLVRPLGLSEQTTLLMLGAGGGGEAAAIASGFGTWIEAYEADPVQSTRAQLLLQQTNLTRRVRLSAWEPQAPELKRHRCQHAFAMMSLRGAAPEPVLRAVVDMLGPGSQLVLLELVATAPLDPSDPTVAAWLRAEELTGPLGSEAAITSSLTGLGFDVRITEDLSALHRGQALGAWQELLSRQRGHKLPPATASVMVAEAERWLLRLRLMQEQRLRLVRWHGILSAPPPR